MVAFTRKFWHTKYRDILFGILDTTITEGVVVEVVAVSEVASVLGTTVQKVKDELHKLVEPTGELPPVGKQYRDRWFVIDGTEVVLLSDIWYLEPIFRK